MIAYYVEYVDGDKIAAEDAAFFLKFEDAEAWKESKERLGLNVAVRAIVVHDKPIEYRS